MGIWRCSASNSVVIPRFSNRRENPPDERYRGTISLAPRIYEGGGPRSGRGSPTPQRREPSQSRFACQLSRRESQGRFAPILRQHRTIASASLRRLFAPLLQFEKREIHTVFLRFPSFELGQKSCLRLLAELRGAALNFP